MVDEQKLKRRVLLRLLGNPIVLAPTLLGVSACTVLWAMDWRPGIGWFAALAGLLASVGAYFTRLILDGGGTARKVLTEMEQEEQAAWQKSLDDLDGRLVSADKDPRPETALRDLRALLRAFDEVTTQAPPEHLPAAIEVRSQVRQLFDSSVRSLEQTMKIYDTARQLQLPEARRPLLEQRERIIADLQAGITQLGRTLAALQQLGVGGAKQSELARLRDELDRSLETAGRVEARLSALLEPGDSVVSEQPLRSPAEPQVKGE